MNVAPVLNKSERPDAIGTLTTYVAPEKGEGMPIKNPVDLHKLLPQDNQLISLKIRNRQGEVIAKWLERGAYVTSQSTRFLRKASLGQYEIEVLLLDGTKKLFLFNKKTL